jgi:putative chitinase
MITADDWLRILLAMGVKPATAQAWCAPFADEVQPDKFSAGESDLVAWLPQILHECSLLERLEECLSYNPERIVAVWPSRFPTLASAVPYSHTPQKLANLVYGGRMGNYLPNDGYSFRGRCPIMLTGRGAYAHVGDLIGQSLESVPELMSERRYGLQAAVHWWEDRIPDSMLSDQVKLRKRVNGGTIGLEHVQALHQRALEAFA